MRVSSATGTSVQTLARFTKPYSGLVGGNRVQMLRVRRAALTLDEHDLEHLIDLYVAGIRQADEMVGRLQEGLRKLGHLEYTLIIVTSDHGEEFLGHGVNLPGITQPEELLRIPLILEGPGLPSNRRVPRPVSIIEIMPTALGLPGISPEPSVEGSFQLYDLSIDPSEKTNLVKSQLEVASELREILRRFRETTVARGPLAPLSPDEIDRLKAFGYFDQSEAPAS